MSYLLIRGNSLNLPLADRSVQLCATSPPYWSLRDYGLEPNWWPEVAYAPLPGLPPVVVPAMRACLGLEPTPEAFIGHLVSVFREVRRVLRDDGTCWLNLGDSYASNPASGGKQSALMTGGEHKRTPQSRDYVRPVGLKPKDLVGIPWRAAFALQADGWFLRSDVIWAKPNPMPESVTDRPTKAHEYVFLLSKRADYFYDAEAIREPFADERMGDPGDYNSVYRVGSGRMDSNPTCKPSPGQTGRNKRTVWSVSTKPTSEAHFATWPPDLVESMILAGTSEKGCCPACGAPWRRVVTKDRKPTRPGNDTKTAGHESLEVGNRDPQRHVTETKTVGWEPGCGRECGRENLPPVPCVVIDPFNGSGTTGQVARLHGRSYIGVDANPTYLHDIAARRVERGERPHKGEAVAARPSDLPGQLNFLATESTTR